MNPIFNVRIFGAKGDGYANDQPAIQSATMAALACNGGVYFPPGLYLADSPIGFPTTAASIAFYGDGQNVSTVLFRQTSGFDLAFAQSGAQQPFGATFRNMGVRALGSCTTAIRISYGIPDVTSDHNQPSCAFTNLQIVSDGEGSWQNGIDVEGAWNPTFENVFISGDSMLGQWNNLMGAGITLRGMCVNVHLSNTRCNFFADGIKVHSSNNRNTEGVFCANCSMVGVQRGVWIKGDALVPNAPRISTLTWVGGLIECRVGGVTPDKVSAAFYLEAVWTALISATQVLAESIPDPATGKITYGVLIANCNGVVVSASDINAFNYGVHTAGACRAINPNGLTFTNCEKQVIFAPGCVDSRSYGHVLVNNAPFEWSDSPTNKLGFVN